MNNKDEMYDKIAEQLNETSTKMVNDAREEFEKEREAENENNKLSKKEQRKARRYERKKPYAIKVLEKCNKLPVVVQVIMFIFAFILDLLRVLKNFIIAIIIIVIILSITGSIAVYTKIKPIYDDYNKFAEKVVNESTDKTFKLDESSYIYDADGNVLIKMRGKQDSDYIKFKDIPLAAQDAFIAIEDRTFWDNPGIDVKGLVRVGLNAVKTRGAEVHGASTITQQLVKNIFLTNEKSLERKGKEALISLKLTKKYSKEQIMEFYINDICFANSYYGLEAASRGYFDKSCKQLSISQIAYLCAIPNRPEYYNPYKYPEHALVRRDKILRDMYSLDMLTKSEYETAINEKIEIKKPKYKYNDYMTTYAMDCAVRYMMDQNGFKFKYKFSNAKAYKKYQKHYEKEYEVAKNILYTGGYKVYTTLQPKTQKKLQKVLDKKLAFNKQKKSNGTYSLQGAITAVDNKNGKVIAVIGGRSQKKKENTYSFNRAYQSYRQPGSTIKPLVVYTVALMRGYTPNSTVYDIDVSTAKKKGVDAQKLSGEAMTLRRALERSRNGVAWQLFDKFGPSTAMRGLNKMKFSHICPDDYYDSTALGGLTYGVSTVEMAGAYGTLVNHGMYREATCIKAIKDRDGDSIYNSEKPVKVYDKSASDTMVDMMQGVITNGTASGLNWSSSSKMVAAGKTGTTNGSKDGWFCGFTPYYTVTVWVGYDTPKTLSNLYGATYPGSIWKDSMLKLIKGKKVKQSFEKGKYTSGDINVAEINRGDTLPDSAYQQYLPGRSDSETLSSGYTVYDYRRDHTLADSVDSIIESMNTSSRSDVESLYQEGKNIVNQIYGQTLKSQKTRDLDSAYYRYR